MISPEFAIIFVKHEARGELRDGQAFASAFTHAPGKAGGFISNIFFDTAARRAQRSAFLSADDDAYFQV